MMKVWCTDNMEYIKIYWMNIFSAVFWLILYISLMVNQVYFGATDAVTGKILLYSNLIHVFLVTLFGLSALALKIQNKRLVFLAQALNYTLLSMLFIQFVLFLKYFLTPAYTFSEDSILFFGFCAVLNLMFFILPAVVNLRTFNTIGHF